MPIKLAMPSPIKTPVRIALLTLPESSASVLYGLYDVLSSINWAWPSLTGDPDAHHGFDVRIVSPDGVGFHCFGGIPVEPHGALDSVGPTDIALISDLAIDNTSDPRDRWPDVARWLVQHYEAGGMIGTVCTGSILLADTGLLDGREATTHWAYKNVFKDYYPEVTLRAERMLVAADPEGRLITSGGTSSWEDLSLYLIGRFCGPVEAVKTAKVFVIGDRSDGQLPYTSMVMPQQHEDAVIADCQAWIADHYAIANPVARMIERCGLPERSFKRRFKQATGYTPVTYVQTLRIEEAKQQLEQNTTATEAIGSEVGYEDPAFFRRLFKRQTGVTPARYRQRVRKITGPDLAAG